MSTTKELMNHAIRELANDPGPCITIALAGNTAADMAIELKDAIDQVRRELQDRGTAAEELLEPLAAAGNELRGETRNRAGMVILRSASVMQVYRAQLVQPVVRVDDRFDLRTLLSVMAAQRNFYILALSQNRTRILKCTENSSEEIPFPAGFPTSLATATQMRTPGSGLESRASGAHSMGGGVVSGTSSGHGDKEEHMLHFFTTLDKAVNTALKESTDPLVAVGVEHEIALYRRVNSYANFVEPGVHGAPDGLEGAEMHKRALELIAQREQDPGREVPADFDKKVGTGHASTHIHEIVAAAYDGRVSHLFFQANSQYMGTYDAVRQRVKHTADPLDTPVDLIETAAYQTIRQAGEVKMLQGSAMPNGVPVCAVFRYPASPNRVETEPIEATI